MTPEQILKIRPKVLTQAQREFCFNEGYLCLERATDASWLARLRSATDEQVERSRAVAMADVVFDHEPEHSAGAPRLRRVSNPVEQHPAFRDTASSQSCPTSSPISWVPTSSSTTPGSISNGLEGDCGPWRDD